MPVTNSKRNALLILIVCITAPLGGYLYIQNSWIVTPLPIKSIVPSVTVTSVEGITVKTDSLIANKTVVIFFTTSCEHCRVEMLDMNSFYPEFEHKINFIGISLDSHNATLEFIKMYAIAFPTFFDTTGSIKKQFHVLPVPAIFYINRQKQLVNYQVGEQSKEHLRIALLKFASLPDDSLSTLL